MANLFVVLMFSSLVQSHALPMRIHNRDQAPLEAAALQETRSTCKTDGDLENARRLVKERRFDELHGSDCVDPATLAAMEDGSEDPDDAWEFLGCGEFYRGPCGNAPTSNCTKKQLPSLLYVGLPHAGSTSLAVELNMHEELNYGKRKEHRYMANFGGDGAHFAHNLSEYEDEFEVDCTVTHTFDATPNYFWLANKEAGECIDKCNGWPWRQPGYDAIAQIKKDLGDDLRIMIMFRDPLDILHSYSHSFHDGIPSEIMSKQKWRNCYADSLEVWLQVFPRSNFLFLDADVFYAEPQQTLDKVFDFMGVAPKKFRQFDLEASGRRRTSSGPLSDEFRREYYAKSVNKNCKARLEKLTGMTFAWKTS